MNQEFDYELSEVRECTLEECNRLIARKDDWYLINAISCKNKIVYIMGRVKESDGQRSLDEKEVAETLGKLYEANKEVKFS